MREKSAKTLKKGDDEKQVVMKRNFMGGSQKFIYTEESEIRAVMEFCRRKFRGVDIFDYHDLMSVADIFTENPTLESLVYRELSRRGHEELTIELKEAA